MNKRRTTLAEALSDAGFRNQGTSDPGWIYVMRATSTRPSSTTSTPARPMRCCFAERFPLRPRDIVYVDVADVARWNRVISNILPTASLLSTINSYQYPLFGGRQ